MVSTCRGAVNKVDALVDDVSRTVAQNAEYVGDGRLHRQAAHAHTVPRRAARDQLLWNEHGRRRELRQQ